MGCARETRMHSGNAHMRTHSGNARMRTSQITAALPFAPALLLPLQNYAREHLISIDMLAFDFKFLNDQPDEAASDGVYVHGPSAPPADQY